jgi:hypothetical protein
MMGRGTARKHVEVNFLAKINLKNSASVGFIIEKTSGQYFTKINKKSLVTYNA